jgi:phosphoribosyl-ATP pyrophosphohydrolase
MSDIRPLVILTGDGMCIDAALMNGKGFRKSREQGKLWVVRQDTGRLLPYDKQGAYRSLKDNGAWYEAVVPAARGGSPPREQAAPDSAEAETGPDRTARTPETGTAGTAGTGGLAGLAGSAGEAAEVSGSGAASENGAAVLEELAAVIRERREKMPEGSYTSYLFKEGAEKIRKKTGEEAVELILARGRDEIVYEASDLIYHLLVLLEAEGIPLEEVLQELRGRR